MTTKFTIYFFSYTSFNHLKYGLTDRKVKEFRKNPDKRLKHYLSSDSKDIDFVKTFSKIIGDNHVCLPTVTRSKYPC